MKAALACAVSLLIFFCLLIGCTQEGTMVPKARLNNTITVLSDSFQNNGTIPTKYTCHSEDRSPHLKWSNYPAETKAFAVKVVDVDASTGNFGHWRITNIPKDKNELKEGEKGAGLELENDFGKIGYNGPCPPPVPHHYYFIVFALDSELKDVTRKNFGQLVEEHALASGTLIGIYPAE
jgi:Raf kinase inhibitor-like YbhB/YbcL family protein